jgi:hypothetical protein
MYHVDLDTILDAVFSMKPGKCCDSDGIYAEHFLNAPLSLYKRLAILTNAILRHSCTDMREYFAESNGVSPSVIGIM